MRIIITDEECKPMDLANADLVLSPIKTTNSFLAIKNRTAENHLLIKSSQLGKKLFKLMETDPK
jgi:hypothetical protein